MKRDIDGNARWSVLGFQGVGWASVVIAVFAESGLAFFGGALLIGLGTVLALLHDIRRALAGRER